MSREHERLPCDLFDFAYVPAWYEQLYELSKMATEEPWKYVHCEQEGQKYRNADLRALPESDLPHSVN